MISIRRTLLKNLILSLTAGSLLIAYFIFFHARDEINELYDRNMEEIAETLESQMATVPFEGAGRFGPSQRRKLNREEEFLVEVWSKDGRSLYRSHKHIHFPLQNQRGMFIAMHGSEEWRVFAMDMDKGTIQVSQPQRARDIFTRQIALQLLIPMIAQIPLIGLFIWLVVGRSLRPISEISNAIRKRSPASLDAINVENIPLEILPMVESLNTLLHRLDTALQAQQRFTADAAHELRTPLTALQLQLNLLSRSDTAEKQQAAIGKLQKGIDRATHLVQQLLTLARLEPEAISRPHTKVALVNIAHTVIEEYAQLAAEKNIDLGISATGDNTVQGDAESLRIVIGNLVNNAIRYTPEAGKVDVNLYEGDGSVVLDVSDTGIGIPSTQREDVFARFHRINAQQSDGSGLGLAIVKHIVGQHQAKISIENNTNSNSGVTFRINFRKLTG